MLDHILDQHPRRLTLPELTRELADLGPWEVKHAVENLAAAQFVSLDRCGLGPAPAVLRFDRDGVDIGCA